MYILNTLINQYQPPATKVSTIIQYGGQFPIWPPQRAYFSWVTSFNQLWFELLQKIFNQISTKVFYVNTVTITMPKVYLNGHNLFKMTTVFQIASSVISILPITHYTV